MRGLSNSAKRLRLFQWLIRDNADIIFLQDTYTKTNTEYLWKKEWGGDEYFSRGTSAPWGTYILFKKPLHNKIHTSTCDENGRYVILDLDIIRGRLTLANIYAPNEDDPVVLELVQNMKN